jgi:hypothetical protein
VAHLLVQTLLVVAIVFLTSGAAAVAGLLTGATFDSMLLGLLAAAPLTILIVYGINPWVPLNWSLLRKILTARGVATAEIQTATYVGVSDPSRSSWRKGVIEEDIGALWLGADELVYRGDLQSLRIPRQDVVAIERDVDPGNVAAVTGAAHPVLVWRVGGTVRRIRLHAEGHWLRHRSARELGRLAERLDRWRAGGAR